MSLLNAIIFVGCKKNASVNEFEMHSAVQFIM